MANKYSRYELQPFPSLYVDNKHPEISQLLANRYDANKTSKDLIDRTLSQLDLLDGDKHHLERVKTSVKGMLKDHSEKQDWENSTLVVQDAAQLVETDAGLIAANKSMINRQAEIKAIRDAKLNGVNMIDFGAVARNSHSSYYYDDNTQSYVTSIYEPMAEKMLDYRSRKEAMVGKIPADQVGHITRIGRTKTNKIANLVLQQYLTDTHEGKQEFKYLVDVELPQTLPYEERVRLAKNQILQDFKDVARQQEFNKVAPLKKDKKSPGGTDIMPPGVTKNGMESSMVPSEFNLLPDKIDAINKKQKILLAGIANAETDKEREEYQVQFNANKQQLDDHLRKIAEANGEEGLAAMEKYDRLTDKFHDYGPDGDRLLAAVQYLTYKDASRDTDWGEIGQNALIGGGTGSAAFAGASIWTGPGMVPMAIAGGVGGFVTTGLGTMFSQWTDDMRNVRDPLRAQNWQLIGDSERDQLSENLLGDEDVGDLTAEHVNNLLGTNFKDSDMEDLHTMTQSWYTFMTNDKLRRTDDSSGETYTVNRMSGDDLFEQAAQEKIVINQPKIGFDASTEGEEGRKLLGEYVRESMDWTNPGIMFEGMSSNSGDLEKWVADGGGMEKLNLKGVFLPDIATNTPLRLEFGFEDAIDDKGKVAVITDPSVLAPGGWVRQIIEERFGSPKEVYDEIVRQNYNQQGYDNVSMQQYALDMAYKELAYSGQGWDEEDLLEQTRMIEDRAMMKLLTTPQWKEFDRNFPQFLGGPTGKIRGVQSNSGFVPFSYDGQTFNQAAWNILQENPTQLSALRTFMMKMSLDQFSGLGIIDEQVNKKQ